MSAEVLPFPRSRDRDFILRHANLMAQAASSLRAEAHLLRQLAIQQETMARRGVAPEVMVREIASIEGHIRACACRLLSVPGGAA
ncbi:DUF6074 family protein [Methylobacterium soli]|uniref:Uncharacterized protein n=1 Tax=Methylobacterium soli TaxID=553447 RepID=A0A6L3TAI5_9HYPH|nr:DUF6074 family protein [Methylobacterium soli]KAB1080907.1 hypothetical protein F6X53_04265 [Methylobacterium soli]GJE44630.1 hypothetical protein AEGHOMDF_3819 [Methylobacterium soli]